ncbi:phenylalanine--tRNA ligase subunit beta [Ceratobasidium sp. 394]|nr:phenylalanine--tRNA ligase subunit beta [Ceratobasidium sp. 394]
MLCIEGIARALRIFLEKEKSPEYKLVPPPGGPENYLTITIAPETAQIRPYFAGAILRNIRFTPRSYASFIDLQDKLHQNIARKRQLVAIGTHDLDTLRPPYTYEALPPNQIKFVALGKTEEKRADELMEIYQGEKHLSRYLHIIQDSPVYPIIYDSNRTVLSMPPIINSEHSKITLETKNVFIDLTATDETKLAIVTNMMVTMFSEYCAEPFTIEPVRLILPDGSTKITPDLSMRPMSTTSAYLNSYTGLNLSSTELAHLLERMGLTATAVLDAPSAASSASTDPDLTLLIPPTRPDILHPVDLVEDSAIAYGFNKLPRAFPSTSTVAQPLEVSKLADLVRRECGMCGWVEVLPLILCSHDENFAWLNRKDDGTTAVKLANPKTLEYQVVRTSLLPGLLKTIRENRAHALPIQVFETSDVTLKDDAHERRARNVRRAAAVWCNKSAGFEVVHGLLGRLMAVLEVPRVERGQGEGWWIEGYDDATYFPGRAAKIFYRPRTGTAAKAPKPLLEVLEDPIIADTAESAPLPTTSPKPEPKPTSIVASVTNTIKSVLPTSLKSASKPKEGSSEGTHAARADGAIEIGSLGILHPSVLANFEIPYPCSALEFDLAPFVKEERPVWA